MTNEALKGHLPLLLLQVLDSGPAHGYQVIEDLKLRSEATFDLPEGTVYPALHRLERDGLVFSDWDLTSGRKRRVYKLSAKGRRQLRESRMEWFRFAGGVGAVLGTAS